MNFLNRFSKGSFEKYIYFKIKEINLKTTKHKKQNTKKKKQNKTKQNHKVKILTTKQTKVVRMEANLCYFLIASED